MSPQQNGKGVSRSSYIAVETPLGRYGFDQCEEGVLRDVSGNHLDGESMNGATCGITAGRFKKAGAFPGNDARVEIQNRPWITLDQALTVCAWIKPEERTNGIIVNQWYVDDRFSLAFTDRNTIEFTVSIPGPANEGYGENFTVQWDPGPLNDTWVHCAGVFDGSFVRLYVNGRLTESCPVGAPGEIKSMRPAGGPFCIGANPSWCSFTGKIDEVWLFSHALSQAQIAGVMTNRATYPKPPLRKVSVEIQTDPEQIRPGTPFTLLVTGSEYICGMALEIEGVNQRMRPSNHPSTWDNPIVWRFEPPGLPTGSFRVRLFSGEKQIKRKKITIEPIIADIRASGYSIQVTTNLFKEGVRMEASARFRNEPPIVLEQTGWERLSRRWRWRYCLPAGTTGEYRLVFIDNDTNEILGVKDHGVRGFKITEPTENALVERGDVAFFWNAVKNAVYKVYLLDMTADLYIEDYYGLSRGAACDCVIKERYLYEGHHYRISLCARSKEKVVWSSRNFSIKNSAKRQQVLLRAVTINSFEWKLTKAIPGGAYFSYDYKANEPYRGLLYSKSYQISATSPVDVPWKILTDHDSPQYIENQVDPETRTIINEAFYNSWKMNYDPHPEGYPAFGNDCSGYVTLCWNVGQASPDNLIAQHVKVRNADEEEWLSYARLSPGDALSTPGGATVDRHAFMVADMRPTYLKGVTKGFNFGVHELGGGPGGHSTSKYAAGKYTSDMCIRDGYQGVCNRELPLQDYGWEWYTRLDVPYLSQMEYTPPAPGRNMRVKITPRETVTDLSLEITCDSGPNIEAALIEKEGNTYHFQFNTGLIDPNFLNLRCKSGRKTAGQSTLPVNSGGYGIVDVGNIRKNSGFEEVLEECVFSYQEEVFKEGRWEYRDLPFTGRNNCGPASLAMCLAAYGPNSPTGDYRVWIHQLRFQMTGETDRAGQGYVTLEQMTAAANLNGIGPVESVTRVYDETEGLIAKIRQRKPVIALVDSTQLKDRCYDLDWAGDHFLVVTGISIRKNAVYVNDPLDFYLKPGEEGPPYCGKPRRYTLDSFGSAFRTGLALGRGLS